MQFKQLFGTALLALALSAGPAQAKITLNATPGYGTDVSVSGTGAPASAPVEAFINGVWSGRVTAASDGRFTLNHLNLKAGDKVAIAASYTWNFNTDGDAEGWAAENATLTVSGGTAKFTPTANDAQMQIHGIAFPGGVDQVIDIRQKNPTTYNQMQLFYANPAHGFEEGNYTNHTMIRASKSAFDTLHWPVGWLYNPTAQTNSSDWTTGGTITDLRLDYDGGTANSGTIEIDFIRVSEYIEYTFNYAGDFEYWGSYDARVNDIKNLAVSGGSLSYTVTDNGNKGEAGGGSTDGNFDPWIGIGGGPAGDAQTSYFDMGYFNTVDITAKIKAAVANPGIGVFWQDNMLNDVSDGWAVDGNMLQFSFPANDGTEASTTASLTDPDLTKGTWGASDSPLFFNDLRFDILDNASDGDTVAIDSLRIRNSAAYGPAEATVSNQAGQVSMNSTWPIQAVKTTTAPTIDGTIDLSGEWAPAAEVPELLKQANLFAKDTAFPALTHQGTAKINGDSGIRAVTSDDDASAAIYFMWDSTNLYMAVQGKDDAITPSTNEGTPGASVNRGDCFQLCLDFDSTAVTAADTTGSKVYIPSWALRTNDGTQGATQNNANFFQFWPSENSGAGANPLTGTQWSLKTTATGYSLEVKMPWTAISKSGAMSFTKALPPAAGQQALALPMLCDNDPAKSPVTAFVYGAGNNGNIIGNASAYQDLLFVATPILPVNAARNWDVFE